MAVARQIAATWRATDDRFALKHLKSLCGLPRRKRNGTLIGPEWRQRRGCGVNAPVASFPFRV
jgi:hypothetical protein